MFYELPAAVAAKPSRVTARLIYYAFDMLYLDGFDLRGAPLTERKRLLEALLDNTKGEQLIKYVDHIAVDGGIVLAHACKLGLEGIVSKRADAPYRSGKRPRVDQDKVRGLARGEQRPLREDGEVAVTLIVARGTTFAFDPWRLP